MSSSREPTFLIKQILQWFLSVWANLQTSNTEQQTFANFSRAAFDRTHICEDYRRDNIAKDKRFLSRAGFVFVETSSLSTWKGLNFDPL